MRYPNDHINRELRQYARAADVAQWQIAESMGVCEMTVSRMLRKELSEEKTAEIRAIIDALREV